MWTVILVSAFVNIILLIALLRHVRYGFRTVLVRRRKHGRFAGSVKRKALVFWLL